MLKFLYKLIDFLEVSKSLGFVQSLKLKFNLADKLYVKGVANPIYLRPKTTDKVIFKDVFIKHFYKIQLQFEPKIIVDAGANIGLSTLYFSYSYPCATIVSLEPDVENFAQLKKNIGQNKNVILVQKALWNSEGYSITSDKFKLGKWGMVTQLTENASEVNSVPNVTLGGIMLQNEFKTIDLLKIDVETAERHIFEKNYNEWLPKTRVIIIELHDWLEPGCSRAFFEAINSSWKNYSLLQMGENLVVYNLELL